MSGANGGADPPLLHQTFLESALTSRTTSLHRFFVPPAKVRGSIITMDSSQELHHLRDVLRLNVGGRLVCFDGQGKDYLGTITHSAPGKVLVRIERRIEQAQEPVRLWLGQGLPKADQFAWIIQKATELGVARISPLLTRHVVVRLTAEHARAKWTRWQRIAREAAKQCRRATIPTIDPPQPFAAFLTTLEPDSLIVMPTLAVTAIPLQEVLPACRAKWEDENKRGAGRKTHAGALRVTVLIGPEGDFSREEVALAERYGARPVSLGRWTLRTDTAALATLAMLSYALEQ